MILGQSSIPNGFFPWCPACLKWRSVFSLAIQSTKLPTSKATVYMASALRLLGGQGRFCSYCRVGTLRNCLRPARCCPENLI